MKQEKQVKSYTRRTKSGKTVTVKAHTAKYEAADKKDASKKKGAGKEIEEIMNKKKTPIVEKPEAEAEAPFTKEEFKEWYEGTGSAADKKVAKALRKQLGRSGYRKFEDEAIDNYTSRGHLSMFKKLGSMGGDKTSKPVGAKNDTFYPKYTDRGDTKKNLAEEKRQWANHYNETKSESAREGYIQALKRYKGIGGGKLTTTEKAMLTDGASSKGITSSDKKLSVGTGANGPEPKKPKESDISMPAVKGLFKKGSYLVGNGWRNVSRNFLMDKIIDRLEKAGYRHQSTKRDPYGESLRMKYTHPTYGDAYVNAIGGSEDHRGRFSYGNVDIYRGNHGKNTFGE